MYLEIKNWIHIHVRNPFKTMKKLKGVFIPLKRHFKYGRKISYPFLYCPKPAYITIRSCDVGWKDKWDTPRYENPPYIWIHLFGFNLIWYWKLDSQETDDYWEQALWYLYYYNTYSQGLLDSPYIKNAIESWPWQDFNTKQSTWNNKFLING